MKYVLLLMGNLDDARCGGTSDAPSEEDFLAFDAELEQAGVLAQAEPAGLPALLLLTDARRAARQDDDGVPVALEDQDRSR